jgi:hypothetical protein
MRIYLNVSCLNRPFDDQDQARIRLESEAVTHVLEKCEEGHWTQVSSQMAEIEIAAMPDRKRRRRVRLLLPQKSDILTLSESVWQRGAALEKWGFKPADAMHIAAAEQLDSDLLLSCADDCVARVCATNGA